MSVTVYINGKPKNLSARKNEGFFDTLRNVKQNMKFVLAKFGQEMEFRRLLEHTVRPFDRELFKIIVLAMSRSKKKQFLSTENAIQLSLDKDIMQFDADISLQNGLRMVFNQKKSLITLDFSNYREVKEMRLSEAKKKKSILVSKDFTDGTECVSVESDDGRTIVAAGRSTVYDYADVVQIVLKDLDGSVQADETEVESSDDALYIVKKLLRYLDDQPRFVEKAIQLGLRVSNPGNFYDPVLYRRDIPSLHWGLEPYPDPMLHKFHHGDPPPRPRRDRNPLPVNPMPLPHGSLDEPGKVPGSVEVSAPDAPPAMPENSVLVTLDGKTGLIVKKKRGCRKW